MKKLVVALLAVLLVFTLVACDPPADDLDIKDYVENDVYYSDWSGKSFEDSVNSTSPLSLQNLMGAGSESKHYTIISFGVKNEMSKIKIKEVSFQITANVTKDERLNFELKSKREFQKLVTINLEPNKTTYDVKFENLNLTWSEAQTSDETTNYFYFDLGRILGGIGNPSYCPFAIKNLTFELEKR